MKKFIYTSEEKKINKVLKMNQEQSTELLHDQKMKNVIDNADDAIRKSLELIESMEKSTDVLKNKQEISGNRKLENKPILESWDKIYDEASAYSSNQIILEDIMTEEEIKKAFLELDEINEKFSKKTGIVNKTDLSFLAIATGLQVAKSLLFPYVAQKFDYGKGFDATNRKVSDDKSIEQDYKNAKERFLNKHKDKSEIKHWRYIVTQPVAYDATQGSRELGINMGGRNHRMYTLGHDPMLGWIFGTANIMTDCITFNTFQTNKVTRFNTATRKKALVITPEIVPIGVMFKECYDYVCADYLDLPAALYMQALHLESDKYTKMGLPVPFLSSINENFASKLYSEHYDALCFSRDLKIVGASFAVSKIIDIIITLTHGLFRKPDENQDLYEVKTRKILLISNSLASTSSIICSSITKNPKNLDIGGLLNTVTHLFTDIAFFARIKKEFVENEISTKLRAELNEIDQMYQEML